MNRRSFLKTIATGAVAAIVPFAAPLTWVDDPQKLFMAMLPPETIWPGGRGPGSKAQLMFVRETAFVGHPTGVIKTLQDQDPQP